MKAKVAHVCATETHFVVLTLDGKVLICEHSNEKKVHFVICQTPLIFYLEISQDFPNLTDFLFVKIFFTTLFLHNFLIPCLKKSCQPLSAIYSRFPEYGT